MTKPTYKEVVTQAVIKQLPENLRDLTLDEALRRYWQTGSRGEGLRLTETGDMMFRVAEIEFYQYSFGIKKAEGWHGYILELNKKLKCPYFLGVNKIEGKKSEPYIRLYDSKIAMMVSLYGDIHSYIDSIKVRK
jgi:hypothetical protein